MTLRLLAAALVAAGLLALGRPVLLPIVALVALLAVGELWPRAFALDSRPLGLSAICGLISLPLIALVLHLTGVPIRARSLAAGLAALALLLGGVALLRERSGRAVAGPRLAGPLAAVAIPVVVALIVGGAATFAYVRMPHPPQPGYTSVALGGWAADIDRPVAFPPRGLEVPIRVSSAGAPAAVAPLSVRVGDRPAGPPRPVTIDPDSTRSVQVYVPAPPDGCLHRIEISLGAASTVFYGRGPAPC